MGGITPILLRLRRREGTTWAGDAIFILLCGPPRRAIVIPNGAKRSEESLWPMSSNPIYPEMQCPGPDGACPWNGDVTLGNLLRFLPPSADRRRIRNDGLGRCGVLDAIALRGKCIRRRRTTRLIPSLPRKSWMRLGVRSAAAEVCRTVDSSFHGNDG